MLAFSLAIFLFGCVVILHYLSTRVLSLFSQRKGLPISVRSLRCRWSIHRRRDARMRAFSIVIPSISPGLYIRFMEHRTMFSVSMFVLLSVGAMFPRRNKQEPSSRCLSSHMRVLSCIVLVHRQSFLSNMMFSMLDGKFMSDFVSCMPVCSFPCDQEKTGRSNSHDDRRRL